jgi:ADP-heptose:LPS heptosyltransferase
LVYVGLDLVGDGVMKLPFLSSLRQAYPRATITWLAGLGKSVFASSLAPLTQGLLDEVIDDAGIGRHPRELLQRPLEGRQFDLIIDTQRRGLTSLILKRIHHRVFVSSTGHWWLSDKVPPSGRGKRSSMIGQMFALLEAALGAPPPEPLPLTLDRDLAFDAERRLPSGPTYVGLAPGAGGKHKCWPLERYIELAKAIAAKGLTPVFLLGPAERAWELELRAQFPALPMPLTDQDSPVVTIALASRLTVAIANDSGIGHMLAAGGAPLISLFGPTAPEKFAPRARRQILVTAQQNGGQDMAAIPLTAVTAALEALLNAPRS